MAGQGTNTFLVFFGLCNILYTWSVAVEIQTTSAPPQNIDDVTNTHKPYRQFLHVSDFHYDPNYLTGHYYNSCKTMPNATQEYGSYECDSPKILVKSAIDYMKRKFPNPDFILWTGRLKYTFVCLKMLSLLPSVFSIYYSYVS